MMENKQIQRRGRLCLHQPHQRNLRQRNRTVASSSSSSGFISLCAMSSLLSIIAFTTINAIVVHSASTGQHSKQKILSSLRGGVLLNNGNNSNNIDVTAAADIDIGGSEQELTDEDLDEYIEFLLAYADDLASESDNPLFRNYDYNEEIISSTSSVNKHVPEVDNNVVEPLLVDDVEDDRQLDAMVEKLVASIEDSDLIEEEEEKRDMELEINLQQQEVETTLPSIRDDVVVEDVDVGIDELHVDDSTPIVEEASLPIEQEEESILVDSIIEDIEAIADDNEEKQPEEEESEYIEEIISVAASEDIILTVSDDDTGDTSVFLEGEEDQIFNNNEDVDSAADSLIKNDDDDDVVEEEAGESINTFYLGSSAVDNMPENTSSVTSTVVPLTEEIEDTTTSKETKRLSLFSSLMEGLRWEKVTSSNSNLNDDDAATDNVVTDSTETEDVLDEATDETIHESYNSELPLTRVALGDLDVSEQEHTISVHDSPKVESETEIQRIEINGSTAGDQILVSQQQQNKPTASEEKQNVEMNIVSSVKKHYQGVWGTVKGFCYQKRELIYGKFKPTPPERDYTKIYEKYFASQHTNDSDDINENSQEEDKYNLKRAFMRPWGTVVKNFKPIIEFMTATESDQYSLGIQSAATNSNVCDTHSGLGVYSDETPTEIEDTFEEIPAEIEDTFEETPAEIESAFEETPAEIEDTFEETPAEIEDTFEETPSEREDTSEETDQSIDCTESRSSKGSYHKTVFGRLWGTTKDTDETDQEIATPDLYFLGLHVAKESTFDIDIGKGLGEKEGTIDNNAVDKENFVVEEVDVAEVAVSYGILNKVDESFDVNSFDISESSGESPAEYSEEMEEEVERNILQLHGVEKHEIATDDIKVDNDEELASVADDIESSENFENEPVEVEKEIEILIQNDKGDDEETLSKIENETNPIEEEDSLTDVDNVADDILDTVIILSASESLESASEETEEELRESELHDDDDADNNFEVVTDIEEDTATMVSEGDDDSIEVENEDEEVDEEDFPTDNISVFSEQDEFSDEEDFVDLDGHDDEIIETESEIDDDECNKMDDSVILKEISSLLSEEMENTNFFWKFLVAKGLEQYIMIAVVISEWFHLYVLTPFIDSIYWASERTGHNILQSGRISPPKWLKTRGGALLTSISDDEDANEVEEEGNDCDQEGSNGEDSTELDSDYGTESKNMDGTNNMDQDDQVLSVESENDIESMPESLPTRSRVRPNFMFRFLLDYGLIGHILIMELILVAEWFQAYVPMLPSLLKYVVYDVLKYKKESRRDNGDRAYDQPSGLINPDGTSRVGKKPKQQTKKDDQKALDNLRNIGDVNQAKYRFITQTFMERHSLGPYGTSISEIEVEVETEEIEADSDSGWILEALAHESDENDDEVSSRFQPNVGFSLGSDGPKMTVGMDFTVGKSTKRRKKKSSQLGTIVRQIDYSGSVSSKKKPPVSHVSDRESGVMGRLRAAGANSLMGRSILGAYPADLPPPHEAGDASGLIDLARKYGYGDWSDDGDLSDSNFYPDSDEDEDENDDDEYFMNEEVLDRRRKRSSTSSSNKKKKSRKRRSSQQELGVSFDFDLSRSSSQGVSPPLSDINTRRREESSVSGSMSSARRRRKSNSGKPRSRLPSPAMAKIGNISQQSKSRSSTIDRTDLKNAIQDNATRRKKTRTISPAMSLLDEKKK
ncbi:hypothetical protein FRACYDRAFT_238637 [Fragilariopsis cylindrus CCMP1102]|uniref:Uncharacterized protein n=1 Tax=Fragilariopsis cylindrus CCMP1102 TaxID=635003 RepID=A0A1E7FD31_9STRA|nr:hypothetical protein FRACYDRAFT_238637 [Fragilariopsis cylindrus CCMP1102]|eukprot:OEU16051.1 hypothetical protein FRACYDRAFT_238637 [Fragilariopsis cylindrus CCMP1102]